MGDEKSKEFIMKLFVRNLSYDLSEDQLREVFEEVGTVTSCKIITDRYTGKSKGFGFIEMASADEAKKAIDELNDRDVGGRSIAVDKARENSRR